MEHTKPAQKTPMSSMMRRLQALLVVLMALAIGYFVYASTVHSDSRFPFKFGLDLAGGSQLVYEADVSGIAPQDVKDAMATLRDVIERRANVFGVSEPIVQVQEGSFVAGESAQRLVVELPGVTDINEAIRQIGQTPLLEFRLVDREALAVSSAVGTLTASSTGLVGNLSVNGEQPKDPFVDTGLTGRFIKRATLEFGTTAGGGFSNEPLVRVEFNDEGAELFAEITSANIGEQLAIFLDGVPVSMPVIREAITGGVATISGGFTPEEARELVRNLNFGALPLPIELVSTQTIGASLGGEALRAGIVASMVGFIALSIFMILWYRVPGFVAVASLVVYVVLMLALFKLIPVVLTAAGIAGFILSVGLAVDANILIAERLKEELAAGKNAQEAIREGFSRAWLAIRDSNLTSIIVAIILFWFGTSIIKGFALVFGVGVLVSMLSAIVISRTFLLALGISAEKPVGRFLLRSGLRK